MMNKEKLEALLIDYIDGKLGEADTELVEREMAASEEARKLHAELSEVIVAMENSAKLEPSQKLMTSFSRMLSQEIASSKETKTIIFTPAFYRVAAAVALLIIGGGAGFLISKYQRQQDQLAEVAREMEKTKLMVMSMIGDDQSASQRIQAVNVAMTIVKADDEVVKALVKAMNEDPNTNVRLAALEALSKFYTDKQVRKELISALGKQKDPIVQIALIQLLVKMKEKNVVNDLKNIIDDEHSIKPVKDEAYSGILRLS